MKLAPLYRRLSADAGFEVVLVHTGQHYDDRMSGQFFRDLALREPHHNLGVGAGSHARQTAAVMERIEPVLEAEHPHGVVVVGDVNSTMAAALAAVKLHIPVIHVEGGLRSGDRSMPEEINRVVTDAVSDVLLITEESARANLRREGIAEDRIHLVGNLMIDSLFAHLDRARAESDILERLNVREGSFGLLTLHRPSNVDDAERLASLIGAIGEICRTLPICFPVHPRTRDRWEALGRPFPPGLRLLEPLGYLDFLRLMAASSLVLTDSGGIQEETTVLGVPCLTLRENTERPVTIEQGSNRLAGVTRDSVLAAWRDHEAAPKRGGPPPLWDGRAAERAQEVLRRFFAAQLASAP